MVTFEFTKVRDQIGEGTASADRGELAVIAAEDEAFWVPQRLDESGKHLLGQHGGLIDDHCSVATESHSGRVEVVASLPLPPFGLAEELRQGAGLRTDLVAKLHPSLASGSEQQHVPRQLLVGAQCLEHRCLTGARGPHKRSDPRPGQRLQSTSFLAAGFLLKLVIRVARCRHRLVDGFIDGLPPFSVYVERPSLDPLRNRLGDQRASLRQALKLPATAAPTRKRCLTQYWREALRSEFELAACGITRRVELHRGEALS